MKKINNLKKNRFFIYTCAFLIISLTIFFTFYKSGVGFVCYGDAVKQHIVTLSYFRSILINFIKTGNFSTFTLELANGMDMYSNLAFYTFGDFINYFSIFFKSNQLNIFYSLAIFIRIYLIGCSYCLYCKCKNQKIIPSVIGAIIYAFSGLVLNQLVHPFFLTPLIIFPLLMLSVERFILNNQKKYLPILITITILTNFYFAYSSLLIIAIYGSILIIINFKGKDRVLKFRNIIAYGFLGILISAVIILPSLYALINSPRITDFNKLPYKLSYYRNFLKTFISTSTNYYTTNIGLSSIILITIPVFISKIKSEVFKPYILLFLIMLLPLLSFKIGIVFSAFQFAKNRWTYTLLFILSYATTMILNENNNNIKPSYLIAIIFLYLTSFLIFDIEIDKQLFVSILLIIPFTYYYLAKNNKLILIFVIFNLAFNSYYHYSSAGKNNMSNFNNFNMAYNYFENPTSLKKSINKIKKKDSSYYNIQTSNDKIYNAGLLYNFNSQNYYYSITSKKLSELSTDLANSNYEINKEIGNFDFRTKINSLLSNKYIITDKNITIPYGYNLISNKDNSIFINNYFTQYAKYYDTCISTKEYKKLLPLEKENILLKTSVLDDCQNISYNKIETAKREINEIPLEIEKKDTNIVINIQKEINNKEVYIYIKNLNYNPLSKNDLLNSTSTRKINELKNKYKWYNKSYDFEINVKTSKINRTLNINDKYYSEYYYDFPNGILINLGYYNEFNDKITISFNNKGEYSYDKLKIFTNDFSNYDKDIKKLNNVKTSDFTIKNNKISFNIECEDNGTIMLNTSLQKGFKLYIDNKQEDIISVNNYFMGFNIEKGKHKIELKYSTPYLKEGIIISSISLLLYLIIVIFNKENKNINQTVDK